MAEPGFKFLSVCTKTPMLFPMHRVTSLEDLEVSILNNLFSLLSLSQVAPLSLLGPALGLEICLGESERVTRLKKIDKSQMLMKQGIFF